jgi:hypothetical protein
MTPQTDHDEAFDLIAATITEAAIAAGAKGFGSVYQAAGPDGGRGETAPSAYHQTRGHEPPLFPAATRIRYRTRGLTKICPGLDPAACVAENLLIRT